MEKDLTIKFIEKWLDAPKLYLDLVLPNVNMPYDHDAMRIIQEVKTSIGSNIYTRVTNNITRYAKSENVQKELLWYPYDIGKYDASQVNAIEEDRLHGKYFLFFTENKYVAYQLFKSKKHDHR